MADQYYGPAEVKITVDDSAGVPRDLSGQIMSIGDMKSAATMVESHGFGKAWAEKLATGVRMLEDLAIEAWYDTQSNGTKAVMTDVADGPSDQRKTIRIEYGKVSGSTAASTMVNGAKVAGDATLTVDSATGIAADDYITVLGHAYRVVSVAASVLTLHRGLLYDVADNSAVAKMTTYFAECEGWIGDCGRAIDRGTLHMLKATFTPTGELVEQ